MKLTAQRERFRLEITRGTKRGQRILAYIAERDEPRVAVLWACGEYMRTGGADAYTVMEIEGGAGGRCAAKYYPRRTLRCRRRAPGWRTK